MLKINNIEKYEFSSKFNIFYNFIESIKLDKKKYLIYGYGTVGKTIGNMLENDIAGFIDKDIFVVTKANKDNVRIVDEISSFNFDKIIVSVLGREEEIIQYLQDSHDVHIDNIITIPLCRNFHSELYQTIYVNATYSPWLFNQEFLTIYNQIKNNTLVDIYRCYEVFTLMKQVNKLSEGAIIEIGVFQGGTAAIIASQAKRYVINENIYLCDTFEGVVKSSQLDGYYTNGEHSASASIIEQLLKDMKIENTLLLRGIFPEDTARMITVDEKFRFCHIDVDVYQSAKDIIEWIWPRMVIGGIVLYDDFGFDTCEGIMKHVEEQMHLDDRLIIYNLNGHAIMIKLR